MLAALLVARFALIAVFLVAGLTKLADRSGFGKAVIEFGLPARLGRPLTVIVPLAELAVALALGPTASDRWVALGAIDLLALFSVVIAVSLVRGTKPQCRCFGGLLPSEVGWKSLARNGVLGLVAAFVAWSGPEHRSPSATAWMAALNGRDWAMLAVAAVLAAVMVVQGWLTLNLLRQNGRILTRLAALEGSTPEVRRVAPSLPGPPVALLIGSIGPEFALPGLDGEITTLEQLRSRGAPVLVVFSDPGCGPCAALMPDLGRWQEDHADRLTVTIVSTGDPETNWAKATAAGVGNLLIQKGHEVAEAYRFAGTPSAVVVGADGRIASAMAVGAEPIRMLVATSLAGTAVPLAPPGPRGRAGGPPASPAASVTGQLAPRFELPDIDGNSVELARFRGREILLVFWDPACGFCQQMLPALKNWAERRTALDPVMVVISGGPMEPNRAMGLRSAVLIAPDVSLASSFGATGTPTAILLDAQGRVAPPVAAGAQAVLALAARDPHWALAGAIRDS